MASEYDRPREEFDAVGMLRFGGYVLLIVAAVVGYFHARIWVETTTGDHSKALFGSLGALMLAAVVPLFVIMIARAWRDSEYTKLESYAAELYGLLHSRSLAYSGQDIIHEMIAVYGRASGVSARLGFFLVIALSLSLLICAIYVDKLAEAHTFTRNQANLLVVYMLMSSFAFWCLLWPERNSRADQLDPSGVFASAMGR